jgi:hypothetical protein
MRGRPIPAVWRIDIEPDDFQPGSASATWDGFVTMADLLERLRGPLGDRSGVPVNPTWFIRLDPDIERCFGRRDFIVHRNRDHIDRLLAHGDLVGIHTHFYRWDEQRHISYTDVADDAWAIECLDVSAQTFEQCFGEPVRRSSQGGYFLSDQIVERSIALGIKVDVTVEPGLAAKVGDPSFGNYATAASPSFVGFPRRPYYPSRASLCTPARSTDDARRMLIVPLTSYDYKTALLPWHSRVKKRLRGESGSPLPLNPWKMWPDPHTYWDLVARAADEGPARYVAFAVRTDGPHSEPHRRVRSLLEYLPQHPISKRLCFVDPLASTIRSLAEEEMSVQRG